jgi:NNP family nitrate/nitrite transporter-like MFS transporter
MVFGAYVALSLWLPKYYVDVYGISLTNAGLLTALFIFPASLLRPFGGWMSDRWGPRAITYISFFLILGASAGLTRPAEAATFTLLILVVGFAMGIGKASVYTYVPEYFPKDVGVVGGLVGCVGGLGGYILPKTFAYVGVETGDPRSIFYVLGALAAICITWLTIIVISSRHHEDKGVM